ncbi:hypothetical protein MRB53_019703 [Persea americana]|uniref:Uncharacterized protein n=1 Tax=Persea americana TaxID=3435 RepID=A0ACC2KYP7_PERAE|nr:hypothetical protein MRB53_019703 [Persea americana]
MRIMMSTTLSIGKEYHIITKGISSANPVFALRNSSSLSSTFRPEPDNFPVEQVVLTVLVTDDPNLPVEEAGGRQWPLQKVPLATTIAAAIGGRKNPVKTLP